MNVRGAIDAQDPFSPRARRLPKERQRQRARFVFAPLRDRVLEVDAHTICLSLECFGYRSGRRPGTNNRLRRSGWSILAMMHLPELGRRAGWHRHC